jgi:hypothetical protein
MQFHKWLTPRSHAGAPFRPGFGLSGVVAFHQGKPAHRSLLLSLQEFIDAADGPLLPALLLAPDVLASPASLARRDGALPALGAALQASSQAWDGAPGEAGLQAGTDFGDEVASQDETASRDETETASGGETASRDEPVREARRRPAAGPDVLWDGQPLQPEARGARPRVACRERRLQASRDLLTTTRRDLRPQPERAAPVREVAGDDVLWRRRVPKPTDGTGYHPALRCSSRDSH